MSPPGPGAAAPPDRPTLADIEAARARLAGVARVTPVFRSETLSRIAGRPLVLKAENLQRTGAFKIRGAVNRVAQLTSAERARGVVCASAGNHGQAVCWAARELGVAATVFVPADAPMSKVDAARGYGGEVIMSGDTLDGAFAAARALVAATGAVFLHPFEDTQVMAGQGTIGLELVEQLPDLATVVMPVGGGGLCGGIAIALRALRPDVTIVGVQAAACAPLAGGGAPSFTIADGIAVKHPGAMTSAVLHDLVDEIVTVSEEEIGQAILLLLERSKLTVEGAGAVGVAALLAGRVPGSGTAVAVLSGGNIDAPLLIAVMRAGLTRAGRYLVLRSTIPDRPGELARLLALMAGERVNIVSIEHHREGVALPLGATEVEITMLTRDEAHCRQLLDAFARWGYPAVRLA